MIRFVLLTLSALVLASCSAKEIFQNDFVSEAKVTDTTRAGEMLKQLPPPQERIPVAVYSFEDQTGQFKYNDKLTDYSSAVTRGGLAILMNALLEAGNKKWFMVVERSGLPHIAQERQLIRTMREQYLANDGRQLPDIPPLLYSRLLIEGGVVSYDSNIMTGGLAANYLGIGGTSEYRSDVVTVFLRAVDAQTGEVLLSVTSSKTIYSVGVQANFFKYVSFDRILQAETGVSFNEPPQLAVRQAIETGVYSLVMEGAAQRLWNFANAGAGQAALDRYFERKSRDNERSDYEPPAAAKSDPAEERPAPPPPPAPIAAPVAPVEEAPPPAPVATLPAPPPPPVEPPVAAQPTVPAPQYRDTPPPPLELTAPPSSPQELSKSDTSNAAPATSQAPVIVPTSDPHTLVKYLNNSRYSTRR